VIITNGPLRLDVDEYRGWMGEQRIYVATAQFRVLQLLMQNVDHLVTHEQVCKAARGDPGMDRMDASEVGRNNVQWIRRMFRNWTDQEQIENVRGIGYRLNPWTDGTVP
jgi:DNA-binding response OmpR family regulator